jgi:geranylgeranyl pyrophosphate synthase
MSRQIILGLFNEIRKDTIHQFTKTLRNKEGELMTQRINSLFDHCMGNGKFQRSCLALDTFQALKPKANENEINQAAKVASSLELVS